MPPQALLRPIVALPVSAFSYMDTHFGQEATFGHVVSPGFPLPVSYNRGCGLDSQAGDGTGDTRDAMDVLVH